MLYKKHIFFGLWGDAGGTDFIAEISKGIKYPYIYYIYYYRISVHFYSAAAQFFLSPNRATVYQRIHHLVGRAADQIHHFSLLHLKEPGVLKGPWCHGRDATVSWHQHLTSN